MKICCSNVYLTLKNFKEIQKKNFFFSIFLEISRHLNSAGAGAVAVRVRKKRQCAGVDNNHTKMLSAVTA